MPRFNSYEDLMNYYNDVDVMNEEFERNAKRYEDLDLEELEEKEDNNH